MWTIPMSITTKDHLEYFTVTILGKLTMKVSISTYIALAYRA